MNQSMTKRITRTGLLLAATLILQGLRLFIPIPPQVSMFVIGSLVNACLVLAVWSVGRKSGLVVACVTPVFAWLEGMLPFLPFIFPVAAGNCAFVFAVDGLRRFRAAGLAGAALCKAAVVYGSFYVLFSYVEFPAAVRHMILLVMSWPQIVTAAAGGVLAYVIAKRLPRLEGPR
ncbi:hypothetical protein CJ260_09850 [Megasphaera sp. ASD88]|jgi:hypothetical protein|uniref:ECF transporter S component n=1 Tax=Megasphaera TaxID=906 RepID=UPI000B3BB5E9|nr:MULTISPECIES: ECF transporter S component [Megasphaera]MDN0046295.1 ECF transporter S component [Megasphaera hexanoica]NJE33787.1 hypothetical protein [Megasphaera sp. SW808]PAV38301.1 hypothetical protein CJ260_09850 [Megasphaera sp. ASD88]